MHKEPLFFHAFAYYAESEKGHHYCYLKAVEQTLERYGHRSQFYLPLNFSQCKTKSNWKRWFYPLSAPHWRLKFFLKCLKLFRRAEGNERAFFIESFRKSELPYIVFAALLFLRKNDLIYLFLRDDFTLRKSKEQKRLCFLVRLLQRRCGERLVFLTDSEGLEGLYEQRFSQPCHVMPIPHIDFSPPKAKRGEKIVCLWPGAPRKEKGTQKIVRLVSLRDPLAHRFVCDIPLLPGIPQPSSVQDGITMQFHSSALSRKNYLETLLSADVILLPYDPISYKRRTSGVFIEAILARKIPVVVQGSWLAGELKKFGLHELIVDWEDPLFFSNLNSLLNNHSVENKLLVMETAYREYHSLDSFGERLQKLIEPGYHSLEK